MNTLFLVADTVRRDYLQPYGNSWVQTPALARLATHGVTFDNHWACSLPCMPARREFLTGRCNFLHQDWGPVEPYDVTLPRLLREAGVFSHLTTDHFHYFAVCGENYHTQYSTWDFHRGQCYDPWVSQVDAPALPDRLGFQYRAEQNWLNRSRQVREEDYSSVRTVRSALDWLDHNGRSDNWFLQVELFDPHEPFDCPAEYRQLYGDDWDGPLFDWPDYSRVTESPAAVAHIRKCYAGLLTMTDRWLGRVLDKLDELRLWDDTLVIFTTDHGTLLGEHDWWMKLLMPAYNEIVRLPLIVHLPGSQRAGTRVGHLTQSLDIMPTILHHHGVNPPADIHGLPLFGDARRTDAIFGYFGKAVNLTDGRHVYFRNPVRPDGGPLHEYTAMPSRFVFAPDPVAYPKVEMSRYFAHALNLPLYKIPVAQPTDEPGRHQLFDLAADPQQEHPLTDPALETQICDRLRAALRRYDAPAEQWERLGLQ